MHGLQGRFTLLNFDPLSRIIADQAQCLAVATAFEVAFAHPSPPATSGQSATVEHCLKFILPQRDDLQAAIAHIKTLKITLPLQFVNFRD